MTAIVMARQWAMPSRWTFTIDPVARLLARHVSPEEMWADPFAGENSPAQETNDLNPDRPTKHHMPAIEFLRGLATESMDGVLFDPPYSPRQIKECYDEISIELSQLDTQATFWSACKDEIARVVKPGGKAICFGWNSQGIGITRGFRLDEVLMIPHGGVHNDTIVTVERSVSPALFHIEEAAA